MPDRQYVRPQKILCTQDYSYIGFHLVNEFNDRFSQESSVEVFHDLGETELDVIGKQFNIFLKQCGYVRYNDNIFMEDITDEEYEALADFLDELREEKKSCVSE